METGWMQLTLRSLLGVVWWWWPLWSHSLTAGEAALHCSSGPAPPEWNKKGNKLWEGLKWSSAGNVNAKQTQKEQITWTSLLSTCVWGTPCYHTVTTCEVKRLSTYTALWKKSLPQLYTRYFSLFYVVIKIRSVYFSPRTNQTRRHMQLPGSEI